MSARQTNGADVLCQTLLAAGIDTCFANPGTSEMHFVAALDEVPQMRCVLGLFEGVVTGAADGYARMAERPAATLLHTGPGLANGLANLHNARRANSPMVNIVGDHATSHLPYDAPLTSDIAGLATPMSHWVGRVADSAGMQTETTAAIAAAHAGAGQIATLVLPADAAWGPAQFDPAQHAARQTRAAPPTAAIATAAEAIRGGGRCLLLLGGTALRPAPMAEAARIAHACGTGVMAEQANARLSHGRGSFAPRRLPYLVGAAVAELAPYETIILIGSQPPVAFFKFPDTPHAVSAEGARILPLAGREADMARTLKELRAALGLAPDAPTLVEASPRPEVATGPLDLLKTVTTCAALLPDNAIVCDESISGSHAFGLAARGAAPHDLLQLTGGAIGIGPALAVGAAIACPDRKVLSLQADGSALYTVQALWTQAREALDIVTVILSNRRYDSLYAELQNMGCNSPGANARRMLDLNAPGLDWLAIARGFGLPATRVEGDSAALAAALRTAFATPGPRLIEVFLP